MVIERHFNISDMVGHTKYDKFVGVDFIPNYEEENHKTGSYKKCNNFLSKRIIRIVNFEDELMISYKPFSYKNANNFIRAIQEVSTALKSRATGITGIDQNGIGYTDMVQTWKFRPKLSYGKLKYLKRQVVALLKKYNEEKH